MFGNFEEDMVKDQSLPQAPGGLKRRNDDPGKHIRPRSHTDSYQSDGPPPSIDDQMMGSLNISDTELGTLVHDW